MQPKFLSLILILVFGGMSAFGFLWMSGVFHDTHMPCPFSMFSNSDCVSATDVFASIGHHLSVIQYLGRSLISFSFAFFIASVIAFGTFLFLLQNGIRHGGIYRIVSYAYHIWENEIYYRATFLFQKWLALHNKQNSLLFTWVYDVSFCGGYPQR